MNINIKNRKEQIRKLIEERDKLFCIIDEVSFEEQAIMLDSIVEMTDAIIHHKKMIKEMLNNENN